MRCQHHGGETDLKHDGDVGGVEELDGVRVRLAADFGVLDLELNTEALLVLRLKHIPE